MRDPKAAQQQRGRQPHGAAADDDDVGLFRESGLHGAGSSTDDPAACL